MSVRGGSGNAATHETRPVTVALGGAAGLRSVSADMIHVTAIHTRRLLEVWVVDSLMADAAAYLADVHPPCPEQWQLAWLSHMRLPYLLNNRAGWRFLVHTR